MRRDAAVAGAFVVTGSLEAVVAHRATPGLLLFTLGSVPVLAALALRRTRPFLTAWVLAGFGVFGTLVQSAVWPKASNSGGVWLFAMILACYSVGAHARRSRVVLGALAPMMVVLAADLPTMRGWGLVSGVVFVTTFIGVLPTLVGRLVQVRRDRLVTLEEQGRTIRRQQRAAAESAVLAERLRTTDRLQPALLDGMRALAEAAESGEEPGQIESDARDLLARTREEVVALTAPVELTPVQVSQEAPDHVQATREAVQPWAVLAGGAVAAGLALETLATLPVTTPDWVVVLAALGVGAPLALVWWRPVLAVAMGWAALATYSHVIAPLDGTLSESAFALSAAFSIGALTRRRSSAVVGLVICWLGQVLVGAHDPLGEMAIVLVCWLGGLVVNEATRLVEQGRTFNRTLAGQDEAASQRAIVDERLRLARELHDQVGHSLTVVALQAGAARRLSTSDPDRARSLLLTIASAARDGFAALDESENASDLASLVELTRATGLDVRADLDEWTTLDDPRRTLVHRLVQEALTNVMRHAPGAVATVTVQLVGNDVLVTVTNSAAEHPGADSGTGRGLAGIRERLTPLLGRVEWGPLADGGFQVRAVLPAALEGAAS